MGCVISSTSEERARSTTSGTLSSRRLVDSAKKKSVSWIICFADHGIACAFQLGFQSIDVIFSDVKSAEDMAFCCAVI